MQRLKTINNIFIYIYIGEEYRKSKKIHPNINVPSTYRFTLKIEIYRNIDGLTAHDKNRWTIDVCQNILKTTIFNKHILISCRFVEKLMLASGREKNIHLKARLLIMLYYVFSFFAEKKKTKIFIDIFTPIIYIYRLNYFFPTDKTTTRSKIRKSATGPLRASSWRYDVEGRRRVPHR